MTVRSADHLGKVVGGQNLLGKRHEPLEALHPLALRLIVQYMRYLVRVDTFTGTDGW